jgi:membrane-associated phospholipid phosphatase
MPARRSYARALVVSLALLAGSELARAGGGPLGIDHRLAYDDRGIWSRSNQNLLRYGALLGDAGLALWEGGETRLGKAAWQSIDSVALAGLVAEGGKRLFGRLRPSETASPDEWRMGGRSFPSGEVAEISGIVTPYVLEYGPAHPAAYALELLPLYDGIARMKVQAHWQSDVLAGFAIGSASGYLARRRENPFILSVLPHEVTVGVARRF